MDAARQALIEVRKALKPVDVAGCQYSALTRYTAQMQYLCVPTCIGLTIVTYRSRYAGRAYLLSFLNQVGEQRAGCEIRFQPKEQKQIAAYVAWLAGDLPVASHSDCKVTLRDRFATDGKTAFVQTVAFVQQHGRGVDSVYTWDVPVVALPQTLDEWIRGPRVLTP